MNFKKYIDIPYKHLGRSFDGCDCWGLIWLIYKEEKSIILPDNLTYKAFWYKKEDWNTNPILNGIGAYNNHIEINQFNVFDVLLFYNQERSFVDHVGMFVEEGKFIHTYRNSSSKIDRLEGYWNSRLYKGVRHCQK